MIGLILSVYLREMDEIFKAHEKLKEETTWSEWEHCEKMRENLGVVTSTTPIPKKWKKKRINTHKKHALK